MHLSRSRPSPWPKPARAGSPRQQTPAPGSADQVRDGKAGPSQPGPQWVAHGCESHTSPCGHGAPSGRPGQGSALGWEARLDRAGLLWPPGHTPPPGRPTCRAWGAPFPPRGAGADPGRLRGPGSAQRRRFGAPPPPPPAADLGAHSRSSRPRGGHREARQGLGPWGCAGPRGPPTRGTLRGALSPASPGCPRLVGTAWEGGRCRPCGRGEAAPGERGASSLQGSAARGQGPGMAEANSGCSWLKF